MTDRTMTEQLLRTHLATAADPVEVDGQLDQITAAIARTRQRPAWQAALRGAARPPDAAPSARPWSPPRSSRGLRLTVLGASLVLLLAGLVLAALIIGARHELPAPSVIEIPAELYGTWDTTVRSGPHEPVAYHLDIGPDLRLTGPEARSLSALDGRLTVRPLPTVRDTFAVVIDGPCGRGLYLATVIDLTALRFARLADRCTERAVVLAGPRWDFAYPDEPEPGIGPFVPGSTYASGTFTEPFHFVMPKVAYVGEDAGLEGQFDHASRQIQDGVLRFGGAWWSMRLLDDVPVPADLCQPSDVLLADIPRTPEAVVAWFRDSGVPFSEPRPVEVDGRTALRWEMAEGDPGCRTGRMPAGGYFTYLDFAYAIPTGHDTILIVGGSDDVNDATVQRAVDALVRSMDFE